VDFVDKKIVWSEEESDVNHGNLMKLVRFRAETDEILDYYLKKHQRMPNMHLKSFKMK